MVHAAVRLFARRGEGRPRVLLAARLRPDGLFVTRLGPRQPRLVVPLGAVELDAVDDRAALQRRDALKVRVQLLLEEKVLVARVLAHLRQFFLQARVRGALPLRLRRGFCQSLLGVGVAGLHARARHGQDAGLVLGRDLRALGRVDLVFLAHCCAFAGSGRGVGARPVGAGGITPRYDRVGVTGVSCGAAGALGCPIRCSWRWGREPRLIPAL